MGWGMEGYMELNPDWNGSLDAAMAAEAAMDEAEVGVCEGTGVATEGDSEPRPP